jgi:hypothetical protein
LGKIHEIRKWAGGPGENIAKSVRNVEEYSENRTNKPLNIFLCPTLTTKDPSSCNRLTEGSFYAGNFYTQTDKDDMAEWDAEGLSWNIVVKSSFMHYWTD